MLSRHVLLMALVLVLCGQGPGQAADPDHQATVKALTAPELAGRGSGSPETWQTLDLLQAQLEAVGLEPAFGSEWRQEFDLKGEGWNGESLAGKQSANLAGILPGRGALAGRYLVVGAHHDHLGRLAGVPHDQIPAPGEYYPGANDNASGVVAVLDLARRLSAHQEGPDARSVLFVFFGGEEVGLQGSGHLVEHFPLDLSLVDCMLNFDTVGQMSDDQLYVSGVGTAAGLEDLVQGANTDGLQLNLAQGGWSGSDHMSFNTREVPVLFIFGGPYPQYNTPDDTWDTLDYPALARVMDYSLNLAAALRTLHHPLQWVMVGTADLREAGVPVEGNRSTWLGTLPDFTEDIAGYKLAGVFDNSPAARGGLQKGDVLVLMAGREVTDLPTFTRALRANSPGDLVEITVLRDGHRLNFTVVLGDRKDRR